MSIVRYQWKDEARYSVDPVPVGKAIETLGKRLGKPFEGVTAEDVVDEARSEASPLHPLFTWDDTEAAEKYRQEQARNVMRSIRVVFVGSSDPTPIIARVAVRPVDEDGKKGERMYVPTTLADRNAALREQMIGDAIIVLNGAKKRLASLQGVEGVVRHIDRAIDQLNRQKAKAEKPRPVAVG